MASPLNLLVIDLETRPDAAILPADRDPEAFPKPIQHQIITLGFLLARIERDGQSERYVAVSYTHLDVYKRQDERRYPLRHSQNIWFVCE